MPPDDPKGNLGAPGLGDRRADLIAFLAQDAPNPRTRVLTVTGELDMDTAPTVQATVLAAVQTGVRSVVIDLTAVGFVDSSGLKAFIGAYKLLETVAGRLVIVNTNPATAKLFAVTGLDRAFTVTATRAAALDLLASSGR